MKHLPPAFRRLPRRAMTLTELLVVILIIAAILAVAVPSFSSLVYSSEATMAESLTQTALRGGRDAAIRSSSRKDAGVAFLYEPAPGGGRLVMVPVVKVAEFFDLPTNLPTAVSREIFVPSTLVEPVQLPKSWVIRGYAPANSIETSGVWYDGNRYGQNLRRGDWVFPENGFYTPGAPGEGRFRQSFMVRFEAGTGLLSMPNAVPAFVFSPAQTEPTAFQGLNPTEVAELRALRLGDPKRYIDRIIASTTMTPTSKRGLIGADSTDMIAVRPISAIALYDETKLAAGLRARIDPDTGCLYKAHVAGMRPTFVPVTNGMGGVTDDDSQTGMLMNQWIEGDTNLRNGFESRENGDEPQARLFTIDRHTGTLMRVETQR